ncbi:hypothetical protein V6N13_100071 [Hibiscus sabdariffa]
MHLGGLLGFLFYIDIGETTLKVMIHQKKVKKSEADDNDNGCRCSDIERGIAKRKLPTILKCLVIKLNAENPHLFRAVIACGGKEPVIGSYRRDESTCLGALLTLAFLSTAMSPTSTVESGNYT